MIGKYVWSSSNCAQTYHFKGVSLNLLQWVVIEGQFSQVRDVWRIMSDCHHNNCHKNCHYNNCHFNQSAYYCWGQALSSKGCLKWKKLWIFFRMNIWFHISCQITDYQSSSVMPRKKVLNSILAPQSSAVGRCWGPVSKGCLLCKVSSNPCNELEKSTYQFWQIHLTISIFCRGLLLRASSLK